MDGATSLGRKGTASILAAIKAKGGRPAIIKDLLGINNHAQIRNGLRAMEEDGLIELSVGLAEHKTIQIRLTPLGEEAANALELMERFIYGVLTTVMNPVDWYETMLPHTMMKFERLTVRKWQQQ